MIDFIVDYGVSIGLIITPFALIIFLYLNIKNPKIQAPPLTKKPPKHLPSNLLDRLKKIINLFKGAKELFETVKWLVAIVLFFCFSQAGATLNEVKAGQKTIREVISKVNSNIEKNDNHLHKCMQDETETMINKLDSVLRTEEPNNVK